MQEDSVYDPLVFGLRSYIYCSNCEVRIARVQYYIPNVQDLDYGGYFKRVFNVVILDQPKFHQQEDGNTLTTLNIYCTQCDMLLGWRLREATLPSNYFIRGRFFMRLDMLMYKSRVTLHDSLFGGANRQDHVQDAGANADQEAGADERNADQDRDAKNRIMIKMKPLMNKVLMNNDQDGSRPMKRMKM
ncbi:uncharacterized protein LOC107022991 [Solanum pennellii]|uniref:Uncharacterized protein LOC107022991 n=1 Tax=Solanum pennellii TaxID=28526 RepID=A0ABM1H1F6_SOLPN|nr:uncharacterized protein LOC107022991 [Solanum pennellii]